MTAIPSRPVDGNDNGDTVTDKGNGTSTLRFKCSSCGSMESIDVPTQGLYEYVVRRVYIQKAFPTLDSEVREAIMMHTCLPCVKAIWANLSEED